MFEDFIITKTIQVGFDIATSVTIITAFLTLWRQNRKQAKNDRKVGIRDSSRASSLVKVQNVLFEFENSFGALVLKSLKVETAVSRYIKMDDEGYDLTRLEKKLEVNPDYMNSIMLKDLEEFREAVGEFYEDIQKRRYSLIPVLDSLHGSKEFLEIFLSDINDIAKVHDALNGGWISLLNELLILNKVKNDIIIEANNTGSKIALLMEDDEFISRTFKILFDKAYFEWTSAFVDAEREDEFLAALISDKLDMKNEILNSTYQRFLARLLDNELLLISKILIHAFHEVQSARIQCKNIIIKLSALSNVLLSNKDESTLLTVVEKYETGKYFGKDISVR